MDHEITVHDIRHVVESMEFTGNALVADEIQKTNTLDNSPREFNCSCGEEEMSYPEAVKHMQEQNEEVTPDTFKQVARSLYRGDAIAEGRRENGFVLTGRVPNPRYSGNPSRSGAIVGIEYGDKYIIALMHKGTETRGRNEPRMKVREAEYVTAQFYEATLDGVVEHPERVGNLAIDGRKIDTGYVNGYRTTPISDVLEEIFKWYAP